MEHKKIALIVDDDFALKHVPPYHKPTFLSFENPLRIKVILEHFNNVKIFEDERIIKVPPKEIDDSILKLAHTKYYINTVKKISEKGGGLLGEEVFISNDTFILAKKAVGGAIQAIEKVINGEVNQSFALIRPPGHHATRETGSGLCIFNNIANSILYLRQMLNYKDKIAIIDIDDHFGDGLCQYFYEDPSVLYASIHEFDFIDWDIGDIDELGEDKGVGTNINFPIPSGITDNEFLEFLDILNPVLKQYNPSLIIVATGFDMYYDDPIGSCNLKSEAYYRFSKEILKIAEEVCEGKLVFILEGGYSPIGLPVCAHSVINALLNKKHESPDFESMDFTNTNIKNAVSKIKEGLKKVLKPYWNSLK